MCDVYVNSRHGQSIPNERGFLGFCAERKDLHHPKSHCSCMNNGGDMRGLGKCLSKSKEMKA